MSKLTEGEQTLTYAKVADLLRAAYRAKAKTSDDPVHEEVAITVYCGAGFNVGITATGYEETAQYAFDAIKGGRKVQATVYYDEDGEEVSGDDSWEDEEDLFCYIPEGYEA